MHTRVEDIRVSRQVVIKVIRSEGAPSEEAQQPSQAVSSAPTLLKSHPSVQQSRNPVSSYGFSTVAASDPNLQTPGRQKQPFDPVSDHDLPTIAASFKRNTHSPMDKYAPSMWLVR